MVLIVAAAQEVFCGKGGHGAVDGLAAVGIARGFYLAVVGKLHLAHPLRAVGGEQGLGVLIEFLSPHHVVSAGLQLIRHLAVL